MQCWVFWAKPKSFPTNHPWNCPTTTTWILTVQPQEACKCDLRLSQKEERGVWSSGAGAGPGLQAWGSQDLPLLFPVFPSPWTASYLHIAFLGLPYTPSPTPVPFAV